MAEHLPPRLDDAELWRSVDATLTNVILPALPAEEAWARAATVQLIGLVRYAATRPPDAGPTRHAEVLAALRALAGNPLVDWDGSEGEGAVQAAAGRALAAAIGHDDDAAEAVRRVLRRVLVQQLDDELAVTGPLVNAFRGKLDA